MLSSDSLENNNLELYKLIKTAHNFKNTLSKSELYTKKRQFSVF